MKKLLTPLIVIVALLGVGALSYKVAEHYNNYNQRQTAEASQERSKAEQEHQAEVEALQAQVAGMNEKNERLLAECEKGEMAWAGHTTFNKTRFAEPVCSEEAAVTE